jgi:peptidoglycan/LPS O-acetylase OafA/YrhL
MPMDAHARAHAFYQEGLTGVRALAACWVMLFHVNAFAGPRILSVSVLGHDIPLHPLITVGWLGVTIFFVLSGFLLTTHLLSSIERGDERLLPRYFLARVRRVIPAYWAQIAILALVVVVVEHKAPDWLRYVPQHLVMLQNTSEFKSSIINGVYWTLPIEFAFYFVLPIIALRLGARAGVPDAAMYRLLALIYAACLAVGIAWRVMVFPLGGENIAWISNQLPGTLDQFVLGTVLAAGLRRWRRAHPDARAATASNVLTLAGLCGIVSLMYYLDAIHATFWERRHYAVYWWYSANALCVGAMVVGVALGGGVSRALFANPVSVAVGTISYSLYLWHLPIVLWLLPVNLPYATFFAVAIALTLAASALSYWLVERPFLRSAPRQSGRSRSDPPPASSGRP